MSSSFTPFSPTHLAAVATGAAAITALILLGRRGGTPRRIATGILAFLCLAAYPLSQLAWAIGGDTADLDSILPLHLCDVAGFVSGFALLTRRPLLCELGYYWGLAASIQGVLTPAIAYDCPHPVFFAFFSHHLALVGTGLFLPLALGWRPRFPLRRTILRVMLWSEAYFFTMLPLNFLIGTNFGFLRAKPVNPSLLDSFGPWPQYLFALQFVALAAIALLSLPFARKGDPAREG